jgi:hypothetical protein
LRRFLRRFLRGGRLGVYGFMCGPGGIQGKQNQEYRDGYSNEYPRKKRSPNSVFRGQLSALLSF